jgi:flagellin-like protein
MVNNRKDQAVSEVMGTILMVALVVILAAVIGSLVFGLAGSMQNANLAGVSATRFNSTYTVVTVTSGGEGNNPLYNLSFSIDGVSYGSMTNGNAPLIVGNSSYIGSTTTTGNNHLVVVGWFGDGTQQILIDTTV